MYKLSIFAVLALGLGSVPAYAQLAAMPDNSFCNNDSRYDVRVFCPLFVNYLSVLKDLKAYIAGNGAYRGYPDIFSGPSGIASDPSWIKVLAGDPTKAIPGDKNLQKKIDAYTASVQEITPSTPDALGSVITALHQKALDYSMINGLQTAAQTLTNTAVANFTSRLDQQAGSSANTSGTTSLTSLAGSADLISIAEESGALTQSVNGATTTYSTNAETLFQVVTGSSSLGCIVCPFNTKNSLTTGEKFEKYVLSPTNISANYTLQSASSATTNTSGQASGSSTTVTSAAVPSGATTLTGVTVKYQIYNKFDLKNKTISDKWKAEITTLAPDAIQLTKDTIGVQNVLLKVPAYASPQHPDDPCGYLAAPTGDGKQLVETFKSCWNTVFPADTMNSTLSTAVLSYFKDWDVYNTAYSNAVANAAGNLLTVQYTYNKPPNQPDTHDATVIYARAFSTQGQLNFNGAISLYNGALPSGANYGRVHYGQVSGEFDRNLGGTTSGGLQSQMSLAGYWQYQPQPSILNIPAGTVVPGTTIPLPNGVQEFVGTAGSLWVAQVKYTMKNSSGVSVPVGVSWSNKTDLLQGNKVGAQVGISYNFQGLSSLFTSKSAAGN